MDNYPYSRGMNYDGRYLDSAAGNSHLQRDNALLDQRFGNALNHKFDTPKRRNKSFMDSRETEQRAPLSGINGMDPRTNSRYMRSPQFG
jgi:hypothetical protein